MDKYLKLIIFGLLTWIIPFIAAFFFYTPEGTLAVDIFLFKSIMVVLSTFIGVILLIKYFETVKVDFVKSGIIVGFAWFAINILLDLLILLPMMNMGFVQYFAEIGMRYLNAPIIAIGMGYLLEKK
jgi:hypothetical protein